MLGLLVLARDDDAGRNMGDAPRRVGGVDAWPAGARGAKHVDPDVLRIDANFALVRLRQPRNGHRRSMNAAGAFGGRYPLHAMDTTFEFEPAVGALAFDVDDPLLASAEPRLIGGH